MGIKISEKDLNDIETRLEAMTEQQLVDGLVSLQRTTAYAADLVRDVLTDLDHEELVNIAYDLVLDRLSEVYRVIGCANDFPWPDSWAAEWSIKQTKKHYNF